MELKGFINSLKLDNLHAMTLECNTPCEKGRPEVSVEGMKRARNYVRSLTFSGVGWEIAVKGIDNEELYRA